MSTRASLPNPEPTRNAAGLSAQSTFAWKEELNARLREHRQRRGEPQPPPERTVRTGAETPAAGIAARVAQRYNNAPSYSDLLAASAAAAGSAAAAAMEAHAAARAVLDEWDAQAAERLQTLPSPEPVQNFAESSVFDDPFFTDPPRPRWEETAFPMPPHTESDMELEYALQAAPPAAEPRVEHHAPLPERTLLPERAPVASRARALVDAFAEAVVPAAQQLPAKLIEFPRELIAGRRQRPRLAEGPLADDAPVAGQPAALRIFEVGGPQSTEPTGSMVSEAEAASHSPAGFDFDGTMATRDEDELESVPRRRGGFESEPDTPQAAQDTPPAARRAPLRTTPMERVSSQDEVAPLWRGRPQAESGWSAIRLGEHPRIEAEDDRVEQAAPMAAQARAAHAAPRPADAAAPSFEGLASIADRALAATMDGIIIFTSFLLGVLAFAACTTHMPAGKGMLAVGILALGVTAAFYGWLFMSFGGGSTPGMRYARIALCTFDDANPTRKDLQNRVPATALALLPLGLGLIWALMDENRLGWHDRMTRTYQRSYR